MICRLIFIRIQNMRIQYLAVFQWIEFGVERRTDDFTVILVCWFTLSRFDAVAANAKKFEAGSQKKGRE
jgi:hypothetical protein